MQNYLEVLHEYQLDSEFFSQEIIASSTGGTPEIVEYPKFYVKNFATQQDLFDWTSSSDYTYEDGNDGVCFGFQIEDTTQTTDGSWKLTLYMND